MKIKRPLHKAYESTRGNIGKSYTAVKRSAVKTTVLAGAAVASVQTASAGIVTDALTGNTVTADITEAGAFIIGLAVLAMGIRWTKATFF